MEKGVCAREGEPGPHEFTKGLLGICAAPHFLYCKFCKRTKKEIEILEAGEEMAKFIKRLTLSQNVFLSEEAKSCYLAWEKAGKGET